MTSNIGHMAGDNDSGFEGHRSRHTVIPPHTDTLPHWIEPALPTTKVDGSIGIAEQRAGYQSDARLKGRVSDAANLFERATRDAERALARLGVPESMVPERRPSSSPPDHPSSAYGSSTEALTQQDSSPEPGASGAGAATAGHEERTDHSPSQLSQASGVVASVHSQGLHSPVLHSQAPSPANGPSSSTSPPSGRPQHQAANGTPSYPYHTNFYSPSYMYSPPPQDPRHFMGLISPRFEPPYNSMGSHSPSMGQMPSSPIYRHYEPSPQLTMYNNSNFSNGSTYPAAGASPDPDEGSRPVTMTSPMRLRHPMSWQEQAQNTIYGTGQNHPPTPMYQHYGVAQFTSPPASPYSNSSPSTFGYPRIPSFPSHLDQTDPTSPMSPNHASRMGPYTHGSRSMAIGAFEQYRSQAAAQNHNSRYANAGFRGNDHRYQAAHPAMPNFYHSGAHMSHNAQPYPRQQSGIRQFQHPAPLSQRQNDPLGHEQIMQLKPMNRNDRHSLNTNRQGLPKPPAHSDHALWVGNVPNDASHEELWRFFTTNPPPPSKGSTITGHASSTSTSGIKDPLHALVGPPNGAGVDSIHLISRSNCAFVNYTTQLHLEHAISQCHGQFLRPLDPRCKPLVCRVRKKDDNVKSGVGAQRIGGMHRQWAEKQQHDSQQSSTFGGPSTPLHHGILGNIPANRSNREGRRLSIGASTSASTSSTTSSFLTRHFPKRFFILKSHTEDDLNVSVERGLWTSQSHNEPVLDQAYRSCPDGVYLVFSANRSGAFFGYARMTGTVIKDDRRVSWASHARSQASNSGSGSGSGAGLKAASHGNSENETDLVPADESEVQELIPTYEGIMAASSPKQLTPISSPLDEVAQTPKMQGYLSEPKPSIRPQYTLSVPQPKAESLEPRTLADATGGFSQIDRSVSGVGRRLSQSQTTRRASSHGWQESTFPSEGANATIEPVAEESSQSPSCSWGRPFPLTWISVQRLPFHRTRDLKNPFNGNREVKISRDGTELEPSVGEALLVAFAQAAAQDFTPLVDLAANNMASTAAAHSPSNGPTIIPPMSFNQRSRMTSGLPA